MKRISKLALIVAAVSIAVLGAGVASWYHFHHAGAKDVAAVKYTCPMHPSYISDRPGKCPICGMDLVPMKKHGDRQPAENPNEDLSGTVGDRTTVAIDSETQKRIGVRTEEISEKPAAVTIRAAGRVAFDQDLVVAEREFLEAKKMGDSEMARAARRRLELMGLGEKDIVELVRQGRPDEDLVRAKKNAWIYAAIYEQELPLVLAGQKVVIQLPDGKAAGEGEVQSVGTVIDPQTRTVMVRASVPNPGGLLKPNMFVTAVIEKDLGPKLLVPKSAVIDSGQKKFVFVVHGGEHFIPRELVTGAELDNSYVVESGLGKGDVVVTNALFLIDSESKLKAALGADSQTEGHSH